MEKRTVIIKVLWSASLCLLQSACLIAVFIAAVVGILLLLGFGRSETALRIGIRVATVAMSFGPALTLWAWRRRPMYPLDALGLFVVPLLAPFFLARATRGALDALLGIQLTRSADAILFVVGYGCLLVSMVPFVRIFLLHAQLPSAPRALFQR